MKIVITSQKIPSFTGFWTKWTAKSGKYTAEARTARKALSELLKKYKQTKA